MTQELTPNCNENKIFITKHTMTRKKAIFFKDDLFYEELKKEQL